MDYTQMESKSEIPPSYQQVLSNSQHQLYPQPYAPQNSATVVLLANPAVPIRFADRPVSMICPHCGNAIVTEVEDQNGCLVYFICIILALACLGLGCCLIPFCISDLKDKVHFCPHFRENIEVCRTDSNMASAPSLNNTREPPAYSNHGGSHLQVSYQPQQHPPVYSPTLVISSAPPPITTVAIPMHVQTPVVGTIITAPYLGREPAAIQCPRCRQQIITMVEYEAGGGTWLIAAIIFIFGGVLGCCLIPFCVSSCQDAVHLCPSCRAKIGIRSLL